MSYVLSLFGSKPVPIYIRQGDVQNIGTGAALTSFQPLPGGGFYDNYRRSKSPQGIHPLSKSGVFWGTDQELFDDLMEWRALLGTRDRIVIEFDNGSQLWQWARLQNIDTPRTSDNKGGWLPVTFTWITAAQNWRSFVHADDWWAWGDGTWFFGDASAAFGVGSEEYAITSDDQTVTVTHNGTVEAPNVTIRLEMVGEWQDVTIINETTGQQIVIDRSATDRAPWIEIDAGARRVIAARPVEALVQPAMHLFSPNRVEVLTAGPHGLTDGDGVRLKDVGVYDGDYDGVVTEGSYGFYVPVAGDFKPYGTIYGGTAQGFSNIYDQTTFSDRKRWLVLAPGDNQIRVLFSPYPGSATLKVFFDDHYA